MTIEELAKQLNLKCVAGQGGLNKEATGVYIGDLLSLVMANAEEGDVWLTVQGHINAVAVAVLVNMPAIILVEGVEAKEEMRKKADEEDIALLTSKQSAYEIAKQLSQLI